MKGPEKISYPFGWVDPQWSDVPFLFNPAALALCYIEPVRVDFPSVWQFLVLYVATEGWAKNCRIWSQSAWILSTV